MRNDLRPWRIMTGVFGAVLLVSFGLNELFSPLGDAALRSLDRRPVTVTGRIAASASAYTLELHDPDLSYRLSDQARAGSFAGQRVRVTGLLNESTRVLEIRKIESLDTSRTSSLDRATKTP